MKAFILILQFLTRIPIKADMAADEADFAKGIVYFPIVGLIIGSFNLLVYRAADMIAGGLFPIVCCLLANTAITGALHLDGIADTCDGIFSSRTKDRMLEIMRDSRIGTNGTLAILFDVLLRLALLNSMGGVLAMLSILLAPVVAKTLVVLLISISVYARPGGMGGLFLGKLSPVRTAMAYVMGAGITLAFLKLWGIAVILACTVVCLGYRQFIYAKLQGMTGDTLGAANEVIEIALLLIMVALGRFGLI